MHCFSAATVVATRDISPSNHHVDSQAMTPVATIGDNHTSVRDGVEDFAFRLRDVCY